MKNLIKFSVFTAISAVIIFAMAGLFLAGCDNGTTSSTGATGPTLTLDPDSITINDDNLTETVSIGGTATGDITLDTDDLPDEVNATVSGTTITVTGIRPTTEGAPAIIGSFTVGVTRQSVAENLTVDVDLTTAWVPPLTLTPASVTIDDDNLTETISVGGTATGTVMLNTDDLPAGVTATVDDTTITVTGTRPTTNVPAIIDSFTVIVTRDGITENLTVEVNLTTTWVATVILTPDIVTIDNDHLTQTIIVSGTTTGIVTLADNLPDEVTATVDDTTITVTGVRPETDVPAINGSFTVVVTREDVTENLTVEVNLTTTWIALLILTPDSITIDDGNLTETVSVSGTATGDITLDTDDLPDEVTATIDGTTITVTGVRPTTEGAPAITGSFTVGVTRQGVTEDLTVVVNLTTLTLTLNLDSVTINNSNLTRTITIGGTATGTITLDTDDLPDEVTATVSGSTITVTGDRPTTEVKAINGSYTVGVTREGITENLTVSVRLTTTWTNALFNIDSLDAGLYLGAPESLNQYSTPIPDVAANNIVAAVTHINANSDEYTLLLNADATVSTAQNLNMAEVKLTIIGLSSERKISLTARGRMFTVGASGRAGIGLTLGNNITLVGFSNNNQPVVAVQNGAAFTMLDGSKVTDNKNGGYNEANGRGSAVYIYNSTFTMKGGTITGNESTTTYYSLDEYECAGGLYLNSNSTVRLEGGSITENAGNSGDVSSTCLSPVNISISGDAAIGRLTLTTSYEQKSRSSTLTVESDWTGAIAQLDLYSYIASGESLVISTAISDWVGFAVLKGAGISDGLTKITLGNFRINSTTIMQAISPHTINASGVLQ